MSEAETVPAPEKKGGKSVWLWVLLIVALAAGYVIGMALAKQRGAGDPDAALADLKGKLSAEQAQRAQIQAKLDEISKIGNIDTESLANYRRDAEAKIQGLQGDLLNAQTANAELAAENTALKETLVAANAAVADIRETLTKSQHLETDLEKAISDLSAAKLDAENLRQEIATQQAAIGQKDTQIAAQQAEIAEKTKLLVEKLALVDALQGKVAELTGQVTTLTTQLKAAQDQIVKLIKGRGAAYDPSGRPMKYRRNMSGGND